MLISGSYPPPTWQSLYFYDLHFYEVHWYEERHLLLHPAAVHAFGIDRRFMIPKQVKKEWDLLFVGAFAGIYMLLFNIFHPLLNGFEMFFS